MTEYVYRIINTEASMFYIGITHSPEVRFRDHRRKLEAGMHDNLYLQNAWNKYGKEVFKFKTTHTYETREEAVAKEDEYLAEYIDTGLLYNLQRGSQAPRHSEETKKKIGDGQRGVAKAPRTKEHCENLSKALKNNTNWKDKNHSEASIDKMGITAYAVSPSGEEHKFPSINRLRIFLQMAGLSGILTAINTGLPFSKGRFAGWSVYTSEKDNRVLIPDEYKNLPRSRKEALEKRLPQYFTGAACSNGHIAPRFTKGKCVKCNNSGLGRGNNPSSHQTRSIKELTTGEIYPSLKAVRDKYEMSAGALQKALKNNKPIGKGPRKGLHFQYV